MSAVSPESPENKTPPEQGSPDPARAPVPKPDDTQGLKQFIKDAKQEAKQGGDVNVANVGEGAQVDQIAVGRNILQAKVNIGALVIPVRFIAVLVLLALAVAAGVWYVVTPSKMPTSGSALNIAVADFGVEDAAGNVSSSADASAWSKWMYTTLHDEAGQLPADQNITLWHDSMGWLQKRTQIGLIDGKTPQERETAAENRAKEINADLLIYGNFAPNQPPGTFVPEFYIAKGRNEADEIRGTQQMGKPFDLPSPLNPDDQLTRSYLEKNLTPRAAALAWFVPGLIDDLTGDFEHASDKFTQALTQVKGLQDDQGKAVFYYYLGREALFLSQDENRAHAYFNPTGAAGTGTATALVHAEDAFQKAIAIDPGYARAYFGLGGVYYQRANNILTNTFPEDAARAEVAPLLTQAEQAHQRALDLAPSAPGSLIDVQALIQLGFDHYQEGRLALDAKKYPDAAQAFQQAQTQLQQGLAQLPADQHRTRAQVYMALAHTAAETALVQVGLNDGAGAKQSYATADTAFDACITEAKALVQDAYLQTVLTTCTTDKQAADNARGKLN